MPIPEQSQKNLFAEMTKTSGRHFQTYSMLKRSSQEPDKELYLPMVVLTGREDYEVRRNAYEDTVKSFTVVPTNTQPNNWDQVYEDNYSYWVIYFATRLPDKLETKFFNSKTQVMDEYTSHEAAILAANYVDVVATQPHLKYLNEFDGTNRPEFEDLVQDIIKSGLNIKDSFFLNGHTTLSLKRLILFLISQRETSQTENGSSGTP